MGLESKFLHALCKQCYAVYEPGKKPVVLKEPEEERCCGCGCLTMSGIYYYTKTKTMPCKGHHGD